MATNNDLLLICQDIKKTVDSQPTKADMVEIARAEATMVLKEHEASCNVRKDHPRMRQDIGQLQGKKPSNSPPAESNRKWIAIGSIIGVAVPIIMALWKLFS